MLDYSEHILGTGSDATAVCYMELKVGENAIFGVGMNPNISAASLEAIVSAVNRSL